MADLLATDPNDGEGFAFFRWASLVTPAGLTRYPGLIVQRMWLHDWVDRQLRGIIYGR
jgi:hypothetical protein